MDSRQIIGLFVTLLLFAILMPVGFNLILESFNSTSPPAEWAGKPFVDVVLSLGALIPLMVVIALAIGLTYYFYKGKE